MSPAEKFQESRTKKIKIIFGFVPILFLILFAGNGYLIFGYGFGCSFYGGGFECTYLLPYALYLTIFAAVIFVIRIIVTSFAKFKGVTSVLKKTVTYVNALLLVSIILSILLLLVGPSIPTGYRLALFYGEGPKYCKDLTGEQKIICYQRLKQGGYPIACDDIPDINVQNICNGSDINYLEKCFDLPYIDPVLDVSDSKSIYWWDRNSDVMNCFSQRTYWAPSNEKRVLINNFAQTTSAMCEETTGYLREYCFFNIGINYDNGESCHKMKSEKFSNLCSSLVSEKTEKLAKNNFNKFGWILPGDSITDKIVDKNREYLFKNGILGPEYTPLAFDENTKYVECHNGYFRAYVAGNMLEDGTILVSEVRCVE